LSADGIHGAAEWSIIRNSVPYYELRIAMKAQLLSLSAIIRHGKRHPVFLHQYVCLVLLAGGVFMVDSPLYAQTITGRVVDEQQAPLAGVQAAIPSIHRGAVTDTHGHFSIPSLPNGRHIIQFHLIGYKDVSIPIELTGRDTSLTVMLTASPLEGAAITITASPQASDLLSTPQSVAVIGGRALERERGQTAVSAIATLPGVSMVTTGSGIEKPVIRGLSAQRVLVVSDGVRQEGQQWGDEHGTEIDPFEVERIEVVRGPNSLLYGSDALGGVVNIIRPPVPATALGSPRLGSELILNGFSNTTQSAGALALFGATGDIGYRGTFSARSASDITTPEGRLANSGASELNGGAMIGTTQEWGGIALDYYHTGQRLELHEDNAGATPFQRVGHDRVRLHGDYHSPIGQVEVSTGWQMNNRREYESSDEDETALHLRLGTGTIASQLHHIPLGPFNGTIGINAMMQSNRSLAEEKLIPDFRLQDVGGFFFEEAEFGDFLLSGGLRFDSRQLDVDASGELSVPQQQRHYSAFTGTAGLVWRITPSFSLVASVGSGWRAPTPFELFIEGVHEGTARYEVGSNGLEPEQSFNIEGSARIATAHLQGEVNIYRHQIGSFIYLSPTGQFDSVSGFPIYLDRQADAVLAGGELGIQAEITDWLVIGGTASLVRGINQATNVPLPLMPADRITLDARVMQPSIGPFNKTYLMLGTTMVADQQRIDLFETPTAGYVLFDAGIGGELPFLDDRIHFDLTGRNITNRAYRDHLSRYKLTALNPGIDVSLKISIPLTLIE
jgi:iron complex outermembrane recepter protein